MCLPWNHKWETSDSDEYEERSAYDNRILSYIKVITQRCTHCGKEIVRKYRV